MQNLDPISLQDGIPNYVPLPDRTIGLLIANESPLAISLDMLGVSRWLPAWTMDYIHFQTMQTVGSKLLYTPKSVSTSTNSPSSVMLVTVVSQGDHVQGSFPVALTRQTNIGNGVVATSSTTQLINDGSAAPTTIIETTPTGQSSSAMLLDNMGNLTLRTLDNNVWSVVLQIIQNASGAATKLFHGTADSATTATSATNLSGVINTDTAGSSGTDQHVRIKTNSTGTNTYKLYIKTFNMGVANDWLLMDHLGTVYASTVPATGVTAGALPAGVTLAATQVTTGALPAGVTLPTSQLTGTIDPAAQIAAGTLAAGILLPGGQVSGAVASATSATSATTATSATSATNLSSILNVDSAGSSGTDQRLRIKTNSTGTNTYKLYIKTYNLGVASDWLLMDHLGNVYANNCPATGITAGALPAGVTLAATQVTTGALPAGVTIPGGQVSSAVANATLAATATNVAATGVTAGNLNIGTGTISTDNGTHTTDGSGNETINSLKTTGTHAVAGGNYGIETSGAVYFEAGNIKSTGSGVLNATSFKPLNGNGFLSKLGYFSGTGSGTVSHGAGATPTWIGITDSQAGSSMTVGVASYTSTQCTVTAGAAHTWLGVAL